MNYAIRPCRTLQELGACVALQRRIWGYADHELYPLRLFVNLLKIGGHALGAFSPAGEMVGFVAAMPAWRGQLRYFHSLSLGVLPEHENRGLGRALKLAQRRAALRAGVELIEWTFDPFTIKNAFFNIVRLGAVARRYYPDHYGRVESRLQQGLPTDRLIAEWWLRSARVRRALGGREPGVGGKARAVEVPIPGGMESVAQSHPALARAAQCALRTQLQKCFARRLVITGFARDERGARYLLQPAAAARLRRLR